MNIFETVRALDFPKGSYVVFGSGPMAAHGLRESSDVDILATNRLYEYLKAAGWKEKKWDDGGFSLAKDNVEIFRTWNYGIYRPDPAELIAQAEVIEDIPFVQLSEVLEWKLAFGREKDLKDAETLKDYLSSN